MRKLVSLLIIAILLLINFNLIQNILSSSKKLKEVSKIDDRIKGLETENQDLRKQLSERDSTFYLEKQARDKLGFGKPGETTIVVLGEDLKAKQDKTKEETKSNLQKWLELVRN